MLILVVGETFLHASGVQRVYVVRKEGSIQPLYYECPRLVVFRL